MRHSKCKIKIYSFTTLQNLVIYKPRNFTQILRGSLQGICEVVGYPVWPVFNLNISFYQRNEEIPDLEKFAKYQRANIDILPVSRNLRKLRKSAAHCEVSNEKKKKRKNKGDTSLDSLVVQIRDRDVGVSSIHGRLQFQTSSDTHEILLS